MRHYYKEIVSNQVLIAGAPVPFEVLDGNRGVIALPDDSPLIPALDKLAGRFGIVKISASEFEEKKSQHPYNPSVRRSGVVEKLRVVQTRAPTNPFARADADRAAAAELKPPQVVPEHPGLKPDPLAGQPTINLTPPATPAAPEPSPETAQGEPQPKFTPSVRRISRKMEQGTVP